jgi:uncharacterized protein (DUF1697 family)
MRTIALLRGVNVGGKNIIKMADLKAGFERAGFGNVVTYINSGNLIFDTELDEATTKGVCEELIANEFALDVPVCVISGAELVETLAKAPAWWNQADDARHDAFFVLPPLTAKEICEHIGPIKEQYESLAYWGRVIFWSAPMATFSRTRVSKITQDKAMYAAITVRNARTTWKLAEMVGGSSDTNL